MIEPKLCEYRVGTTEAGLTPFFVIGISPPNTSQYKNFSKTDGMSDGGAIQSGYKSIEMTWLNLSAKVVFEIKKQVEAALSASRQLYLTIPLNDGQTIASRQFNNIVGFVRPLTIHEGKQGGRGMVYPSLTLVLNNVTILGVA